MDKKIVLHPIDANGQKDSSINLYPKTTADNVEGLPTKLSEFVNDEGFITEADVPTKTSELINDSDFIDSSALEPYATTEEVEGYVSIIEGVLDVDLDIGDDTDRFEYNGDTVTFKQEYKNLKTGVSNEHSENIALANDTTAGMMSPSDYSQIRNNTSRIQALEGRPVRLLYTAGSTPTAAQISAFVTSAGYTDNLERVSVVVSSTRHVWNYYTGSGWRDDGIDTVSQFSNSVAGIIKGAQADGKVYAENDGTGSVYGWSDLLTRVGNIETKDSGYDTHISNTTIHVTAADKTKWNGKQDAISDIDTIRQNAANALAGLANKEDVSNKASAVDTSTTKYPTNSAVSSFVNTSVQTEANARQTADNTIKTMIMFGYTEVN